jgi:hypothetical protein
MPGWENIWANPQRRPIDVMVEKTRRRFAGLSRRAAWNCSTHKDQINADLLAFIKGEKSASA